MTRIRQEPFQGSTHPLLSAECLLPEPWRGLLVLGIGHPPCLRARIARWKESIPTQKDLAETQGLNLGAGRRLSGASGQEVPRSLAVACGTILRPAGRPSAFRTGLSALTGPFW